MVSTFYTRQRFFCMSRGTTDLRNNQINKGWNKTTKDITNNTRVCDSILTKRLAMSIIKVKIYMYWEISCTNVIYQSEDLYVFGDLMYECNLSK